LVFFSGRIGGLVLRNNNIISRLGLSAASGSPGRLLHRRLLTCLLVVLLVNAHQASIILEKSTRLLLVVVLILAELPGFLDPFGSLGHINVLALGLEIGAEGLAEEEETAAGVGRLAALSNNLPPRFSIVGSFILIIILIVLRLFNFEIILLILGWARRVVGG